MKRRAHAISAASAALFALACAACASEGGKGADAGRDKGAGGDATTSGDLARRDGARQDARADRGIVLREAGPDTTADTLFVCNPPAAAGSLYELSASALFRQVSMCEYRDRVLLVANVAAK